MNKSGHEILPLSCLLLYCMEAGGISCRINVSGRQMSADIEKFDTGYAGSGTGQC